MNIVSEHRVIFHQHQQVSFNVVFFVADQKKKINNKSETNWIYSHIPINDTCALLEEITERNIVSSKPYSRI